MEQGRHGTNAAKDGEVGGSHAETPWERRSGRWPEEVSPPFLFTRHTLSFFLSSRLNGNIFLELGVTFLKVPPFTERAVRADVVFVL